MTIKIYDYVNKIKKIEVPVDTIDEIEEIIVNVLSGDETGLIVLRNGKVIDFDASDCRFVSFNDYRYIVSDKQIEKWLKFKPDGKRTASYQRAEFFCGW